MATKASLILGAIILKEFCVPKPPKVSSIEITVPKSPINGEVEATILSQVSPLDARRLAKFCKSQDVIN